MIIISVEVQMPNNTWILEVLDDIILFAESNNLPNTARELTRTLQIVKVELEIGTYKPYLENCEPESTTALE